MTEATAKAHKWEFKARFGRVRLEVAARNSAHQAGGQRDQAGRARRPATRGGRRRDAARADLASARAGGWLVRCDGTAVNNAIAELIPIIASTPADLRTRGEWLKRLWVAHQADEKPYIELLADYWGELCVSRDVASVWADRLVDTTRMALSSDRRVRGFFHAAGQGAIDRSHTAARLRKQPAFAAYRVALGPARGERRPRARAF